VAVNVIVVVVVVACGAVDGVEQRVMLARSRFDIGSASALHVMLANPTNPVIMASRYAYHRQISSIIPRARRASPSATVRLYSPSLSHI